MRARRKRQLKNQKYPKQVKKVEDWGGGGSIACSKDKRVSYRRFGLMSAFRPRGLTKGYTLLTYKGSPRDNEIEAK